jgi:hypothetical protein
MDPEYPTESPRDTPLSRHATSTVLRPVVCPLSGTALLVSEATPIGNDGGASVDDDATAVGR